MRSEKERFEGICKDMIDTFEKKNADYGNSFKKLFDEFGMVYAVAHIAEKTERLKQLSKNKGNGLVKTESVKDTLMDCANYCVLTLMELDRYTDEV